MQREVCKDTISIANPVWTGDRFNDVEAQSFWSALPPSLQAIALAEQHAGNPIVHILCNIQRNLVLLAFGGPPLTECPSQTDIFVHTSHAYGNYCYDDTLCTYEHIPSGCFLAFAKLTTPRAC